MSSTLPPPPIFPVSGNATVTMVCTMSSPVTTDGTLPLGDMHGTAALTLGLQPP